ncbi:hypothetical protein SARC_05891 [Sphaeroforma arctica JP610]|uniref:UspA domain-containing protein n=1 Tax=Sphaeroforma arctica JP610 TaxID=667725 RepID=A0A0L0FZ09_9EUKA|nr:hypothetical protein SARC_05891 [Sphaeroforma arctica JP610]KNC81806.1 hypothetical protein SARC_05891 [Sphaeroforma arctica JP610]|eukprot:XP_014155708.1 hypothetical protein SARC_05891 [Sphaeroforma arctica JP610]
MVKQTRHVLIGLDGSDCSKHALKWALDNVVRDKDLLFLVIAFQPQLVPLALGPDMEVQFTNPPDNEIEKMMSQCNDYLEQIGTEVIGERSIEYKLLSLQGDPRDVFPAVCDKEQIDMVVVGSRGMGAIKRLLVGSVSDALVHNLKVPVTVVHPPETNEAKQM